LLIRERHLVNVHQQRHLLVNLLQRPKLQILSFVHVAIHYLRVVADVSVQDGLLLAQLRDECSPVVVLEQPQVEIYHVND
jgi:hypothetical protein